MRISVSCLVAELGAETSAEMPFFFAGEYLRILNAIEALYNIADQH
jgi:hypothetical protein